MCGPQGCIRTAVHCRRRGGCPPLDPPPPPPLPMFVADSQNFAAAPSVPRGFKLQIFFGPPLAGTIGEPKGGGTSQPTPPPPPLPPLLIHPWWPLQILMRVLVPLSCVCIVLCLLCFSFHCSQSGRPPPFGRLSVWRQHCIIHHHLVMGHLRRVDNTILYFCPVRHQ